MSAPAPPPAPPPPTVIGNELAPATGKLNVGPDVAFKGLAV